jgi:transcriptional regulator with XRE-family HTH domain
MGRSAVKLLPRTAELLTDLGERIKLARRRRGITSEQMSDRVGISMVTYRKIEAGDASVAMGHYLATLQALQLQSDLALLAREDSTGRLLQDSKLLAPTKRWRTPRTVPEVAAEAPVASSATAPKKAASGEGAVTNIDFLHLLERE